MKRPWLLTQSGQRTALHLSNLVALALFLGFALHFSFIEYPRTQVPQLDTSAVTYCELAECDQVFGIELINGTTAQSRVTQTSIGVELELEFLNSARFEGRRELWLRMESANGAVVEAASTWIDLGLKTRSIATFVITGTVEEVQNSRLLLGY